MENAGVSFWDVLYTYIYNYMYKYHRLYNNHRYGFQQAMNIWLPGDHGIEKGILHPLQI